VKIDAMRRTGQWLRFIGLLIEMVGAVGVVREKGGQATPQIQVPGGPVVSTAWVAVGLGFVLWLVGQILLAAARTRRPDSP
jgi:drug/metabolite transporter (DMT)-like permease